MSRRCPLAGAHPAPWNPVAGALVGGEVWIGARTRLVVARDASGRAVGLEIEDGSAVSASFGDELELEHAEAAE